MSENHQINLNINAAGAKRGASEWKAAITQITEATKAYKAAMDQLGGTKTKVDFAKTAKELGALGSIRINSASAKNIAALSAALRGFRGPSAAQIKSTRDFLRVVASAQVNTTTARSIASISQAFSGFRGPTRNSAAAVRDLFKALNGTRLNPQTASHLAAITAALANFRGPSAVGVRNIDSLVNSLNRLRTPPNLTSLSAALNAIAASGARAGASTQRLTQSQQTNTVAMQRNSSAALRLTGDMRGLENAFSLSYQMGSQLRVLFGSLTFAEFTRGVYDSTLAVQKFQTTMGVTSQNLATVQAQMNFATGIADKYGISIAGVYDEYGRFATAAKLAGQSTENVKYIFESVSSAMRVMGTDTMGQQRVFRALTQMFSKGAVRAEELVQQLGEQIPGAFQVMQDALSDHLGKPVDLAKMLELGQVDDSAVVLFAEKLGSIFGPKVAEAMERADSWIGRLQNSWFKFQALVGQGGVQDALGDVAKQLSQLVESADFQTNAVNLAKALGDGIRLIGDGSAWAVTHIRELGVVLMGLLTGSVVSNLLRIGTAIASMAASAGLVGFAFAAIPAVIGGAVAALAYYWDETVKIGDQSATVGTIATQAFIDIKTAALNAWDVISQLTFDRVVESLSNFTIAAFSSFNSVSTSANTNAIETATAWDKAFTLAGASAQGFGTRVTKSFLQLASAGKNYAVFKAQSLMGGDEDALWADFIKKTKSEFDGLENAANQTYQNIIKDWGLSRKDLEEGFSGILESGLEDYVKRAKEMEAARQLARSQEEADRKAREKARAQEEAKALGNRPAGDIDPLKDGGASGKDSVSKRLKDAEKATANYRAEVDLLLESLKSGKITLDQYNQGLEYQAQKMQESADPYAAMVRSMQDEIGLQGMATRARNIEIAHREKINELAEKGIQVTAEQSEKLRQLITTQQQMNNRPLKDWVDGIEEVGVATDRVAVTAMEGLSDQIADLVVTGKADFASLAQSILKDFIKVGLNSLYKDVFGKMFGGSEEAPKPGQVSKPATGVWDAAQSHLTTKTNDWEMRGGFGVTGDPEIYNANQGLNQLNASSMQLRGTLDYMVKSFETAGPQVDNMTTGAINAANALNQLAGAASGQSPTAALSQPFPGQAQAAASASAPTLAVTQSPARIAATPFNFSNKTLTLTPQEITDLKKTLMTEVDAGLKGASYDSQASGVVDTIMNRKVSGRWGNSITDVVNAKSQFSDINGPVAWKNGRSGVEYLSDSLLESGRGKKASDFVDQYLAKRMNGVPSSVGGNLHYANPNFSDSANRAWIDKLQGPTLGEGDRIHKHGTTAGFQPVDPNYAVRMAGQPLTSTPGIQGIEGLNWSGKMMQDVKGLTLHHTGGRGTPQDVISTLNKRGFGAQYIMDREGKIFQTVPDGAQVSHMKNAQNGSGLNNSNALGIEMIAKDNNDLTPAQIASGQQWIEQMREKYPGIGNNVFGHGELNSHKQETEGMGVVNAWRESQQQTAAVDPTVTGSIQQVNTQLQTLGQNAQQAATQTQSAQQMTTVANQQKMSSEQQAGLAVQTAGQQALQAAPGFQQAGQSISSASQQASQAQPGFQQMSSGLGALLGPLSSVIPGLGQFGGAIMSLLGSLGSTGGMGGGLFGLFREGGIATEPVALGKMPHFAEGTANTGSYGRGGIPSVLHPNEAVIPLSRGRKVPVEMNTREDRTSTSEFSAAKQGGGNTFNLNLSGIKSADDFKRSQRQINQRLAYAQERTQRRNS